MIISIVNQKGGVGKTVTAVNLSAALAEAGNSVLLIDLDAQHNATLISGVRDNKTSIFDVLVDPDTHSIESAIVPARIEGVALVPGHASLARLDKALDGEIGREMGLAEVITPIRNQYEYIIIDNGPMLGLAPAMSLCAADLALVPVACEELALIGLQQVLKTIEMARRRANPKLKTRLLLTMLDARTSHGKQTVAELRTMFGASIFEVVIGRSSKFAAGALQGGSVLQYAPRSAAADSYRRLSEEIQKQETEKR